MLRLWRALAAGCLVPIALAGAPSAAAAHALVLESSPRADEVVTTAPSKILLRFNSRIEARLSRVGVSGPTGGSLALPVSAPGRAPNELAVPVPPLQPGRYVVRWKVFSADGHVTEGVLRFTLAP